MPAGEMDQETRQVYGAILSELRRNSGYLARNAIEELLTKIRTDAKRLEPFGFKVYSQNDEDGIVEEIFKRLNIKQGRFCEIGVENGLECNTLYLIHKGWTGSWIETNRGHLDFILKKFAPLLANNRLQLIADFVTAENVNAHMERCGHREKELDFLSIDIDGNDIYLLEALNYFPKVICIEYNAKFPPPLAKKPVYKADNRWRGTDYMGASLVAIAEAARQKGYALVGTSITGANAFLVRDDLVGDLFCSDRSSENLYNPARYYLTYDAFQQVGHPPDFGDYTDLV